MNKILLKFIVLKARYDVSITSLINTLYYKALNFYRFDILVGSNTRIEGIGNINSMHPIQIGLKKSGFSLNSDKTFLSIRGKLNFHGKFCLYKGCRFDIGPNSIVDISSGYFNSNVWLISQNKISIGSNCAIGWNTQLLDDSLHTIIDRNMNTQSKKSGITIGDDVWIGHSVSILPGSVIGDGCIVASNSVVTKSFDIKNALIAGNPARIVKENVSWF